MSRGIVCTATSEQYAELAYNLALSVMLSTKMKIGVTLIVDQGVEIPKWHLPFFEHVIVIPKQEDGFTSRLLAFELTPYDRTLLMDADMLVSEDISWWFDVLGDQHVSWGKATTFQGKDVARNCRRAFDAAQLPDVYSACFYFDKSGQAAQFFQVARAIHHDWDKIRKLALPPPFKFTLIRDTDVVLALAAKALGVVPSWQPSFVHLKPELQQAGDVELHADFWGRPCNLLINHNAVGVLHYVKKDWITEQMSSFLKGRVNALRHLKK